MQNLSSQFGILTNLTKNESLFTNPNSKDQYLPDTYATTADPAQLTPLQVILLFFSLIYTCVYVVFRIYSC